MGCGRTGRVANSRDYAVFQFKHLAFTYTNNHMLQNDNNSDPTHHEYYDIVAASCVTESLM